MGQPGFELPSDGVLQGLMDELDKALKGIPDSQRQLMSLSAVAWSDDGMVKVEVGPRGQLVDLEIDPRVFRRPDAQALRASILAAVNQAVSEVTQQAQEIMHGHMPPELAELRGQFQPAEDDAMAQLMRTDADLMAERRRAHDDLH